MRDMTTSVGPIAFPTLVSQAKPLETPASSNVQLLFCASRFTEDGRNINFLRKLERRKPKGVEHEISSDVPPARTKKQ
jgi:hypothetical protein